MLDFDLHICAVCLFDNSSCRSLQFNMAPATCCLAEEPQLLHVEALYRNALATFLLSERSVGAEKQRLRAAVKEDFAKLREFRELGRLRRDHNVFAHDAFRRMRRDTEFKIPAAKPLGTGASERHPLTLPPLTRPKDSGIFAAVRSAYHSFARFLTGKHRPEETMEAYRNDVP